MPTLLQGRYEIIQTIGAGGFGETFLATDTQVPSKRKCVIKKFKPKQQLDPATFQLVRERFEREAAVLESLGESHPQIPRLYAYFIKQGEYYLVQESVEGKTIRQLVSASGQFSEDALRQLLVSLLPVLDFIHSKKVIHRDITPDNSMLRQSDGLPVLIDFGAVKEIVTSVVDSSGKPVQESIRIGTSGYAPPEQAIGMPVYASDLYSLAMTSVFALTCKEPKHFHDPQTGQIKWETEANHISPQLRTVLSTASQRDYHHRFDTAKKMLAALTPIVVNNAVQQQPVVSPKPVRSVNRKRRALLLVGSLVALIVVLGGLWLRSHLVTQSIQSKLSEVRVLLRHKDHDRALTLSNEVIDADPTQAEAYLLRGQIWDQKREEERAKADHFKAIELLDKTIRQNPRDAVAYKNRGEVYSWQKKYDKSLEDLNACLDLDGKYLEALDVRSCIYLAQKKYDKVLEDANTALRLDEKYVEALAIRGRVFYDQKKYDKALEEINAALKLDEKYVDALFLRGAIYYEQNKYDKALEALNAALSLDKNHARALAWRGSLYEDNKRNLSAARDDYKRALELDPSLDWVRKRLTALGTK